jgi:hypothetical protein
MPLIFDEMMWAIGLPKGIAAYGGSRQSYVIAGKQDSQLSRHAQKSKSNTGVNALTRLPR